MEKKKDDEDITLLNSEDSAEIVSDPLETQIAKNDDILQEKLENAFHKHTSKFILHDLAKIASEHSPIDLAYAACRLPPSVRPIIYENLAGLLPKIEFMINTDSSTRSAVFWHIEDAEAKELIEEMPPDEAVVVLEAVSERRFRRLMELIDPAKALRIREIKGHHLNTAGRMMTNEFFSFRMEVTIGEASNSIRDNPGIDLTRRIFVLNDEGELQGYVPARNLIVNPDHLHLSQVMKPVLHKVGVDSMREEVVDLVERYKISALPVCSKDNILLGVITYEDVIEAIEDIADETIAQIAGTGEKVREHEPMMKRFASRVPWLFVTLLAGLVNFFVMQAFETRVAPAISFMVFLVPLITGLSGNIGIQCSTVLVRSMALGLLSAGSKWETMIKEMTLGISMGLFFGTLCSLFTFGITSLGLLTIPASSTIIGLIVGAGIVGSCLAGTVLGVFSPVFFIRIGVDPAVASGPIITACNDFLSMTMYFLISMGLASWLL